jgi:hypothetical protein
MKSGLHEHYGQATGAWIDVIRASILPSAQHNGASLNEIIRYPAVSALLHLRNATIAACPAAGTIVLSRTSSRWIPNRRREGEIKTTTQQNSHKWTHLVAVRQNDSERWRQGSTPPGRWNNARQALQALFLWMRLFRAGW